MVIDRYTSYYIRTYLKLNKIKKTYVYAVSIDSDYIVSLL